MNPSNNTALSVNLNKIALIRNSRPGNYPSVVSHGEVCINAGADGLTVHPRPDQRHIRPHDVYELSELVKSHAGIEFNIEGNPYAESLGDFPGFIKLVQDVQPHQAAQLSAGATQWRAVRVVWPRRPDAPALPRARLLQGTRHAHLRLQGPVALQLAAIAGGRY